MSLSTFQQQGDIIDHTVTGSAVKAGAIVVAGDLVGQIVTDGAVGDVVGLRVEGVIHAPKLTTDVVVVGAKLYWDAGNSRLTTTASTHKTAGYAVEAAGDGVASVSIKLDR